jgi:hypothetical protein
MPGGVDGQAATPRAAKSMPLRISPPMMAAAAFSVAS